MNQGIVAVDIGGSHITSVMIENLAMGDFATSFQYDKVDSQNSLESIIQAWYANISATIAQVPHVFANKIAIAIPGPFDYENGIGLYAKNGKFAALKNTNIHTLLHSQFAQQVNIHFENDAACFGLGESHFGEVKDYTKSMAITLGTGIGCTFLDKKQVIKTGKNVPMGGEIFHLPYRVATADDYFSTRWFVRRIAEKYDLKISGVKELTLAHSEYDFAEIFLEFADNLVEFLLPIAQRFGAEAMVFGGNISKAWAYFAKPLQTEFAKHGIEILQSTLNEDAICLGAAQSLYNKNIILSNL